MISTESVWFITGCSTGLGRDLARLVIKRGWRSVITARDPASLAPLVQASPETTLALKLDVTDATQIEAAVSEAESRFGAIDVLVNNAGYGYQASVEEGVDSEIRAQFETNVFGLFALTRAILPGMRKRRRGHILNVTSVAGLVGFPGSGYYAASKHAVEGWSDALAAEGRPLGIRVTCVEPGPFRTDWAGRSLQQTMTKIADYEEIVGARMRGTAANSGKQPGDPERGAAAMIRVAEMDEPPRHLVLGRWGMDTATAKLCERIVDIEASRDISEAADYLI